MKTFKHSYAGFFKIALFALPVCFSALNCKKTVIENPFTDSRTLDCRNLLIRKVELKDSIVEVTLENTCKNCEDNWVYLGMVMINRQLHADTIAQTACLTCLSCPKNGESIKYQLKTTRTSLPDLRDVQVNFGYLCTDVTYLPK